jgi:hypothetical protein
MIDGESGSRRAGQGEREFVCPTLRLLALPYFDHPDYQDKWRVTSDFAEIEERGCASNSDRQNRRAR